MGDMRMYQDTRRLDFHALGREIKRKREAKGWTQEYLAQLVDRTPRSIMYFENRADFGPRSVCRERGHCARQRQPRRVCHQDAGAERQHLAAHRRQVPR